MLKKWGIASAIGIFLMCTFFYFSQPPKLVSCITDLDQAYLTVLVNPLEFVNLDRLEKKIVFLCVEDGFENMRLYTEGKAVPKEWHIKVYSCRNDLKMGKNGVVIDYEQ